jgi:YVTN family beta-propeller protein
MVSTDWIGSDQVSVIDVGAHTVVATIPVGINPFESIRSVWR